jgi:hypothetical protein
MVGFEVLALERECVESEKNDREGNGVKSGP